MKAEHYYKGEEIVWGDNNVCALNNFSGLFEQTTKVPEGSFLRVCLVNSFNGSSDNVSEKASAYAVRKARHRNYTLINGDKVVGWATWHRDRTEEEDNEDTTEDTESAESTENTEGADGASGVVGIGIVFTDNSNKVTESEERKAKEPTCICENCPKYPCPLVK